MGQPDYLAQLMKELSAVDFLKAALQKLDEIEIKTEDELLLLDKVLFKVSNISRDIKIRMLTPQLREKFVQGMKELKLSQNDFTIKLQPYIHGKGPYTKLKSEIDLQQFSAPEKAIAKPAQEGPPVPFKPAAQPEKTTVIPSSDKKQPSFRGSRRSDERGGTTPKRPRSSSSSGSSSDSDEKAYKSEINKLQEKIAHLNAERRAVEMGGAPAKFGFALKKKPEGAGRTVFMSKDDPHFERSREPHSERSREPRSERGDRDFRGSPDSYSPPRSDSRSSGKWDDKKGIHRNKIYKPSFLPYKH